MPPAPSSSKGSSDGAIFDKAAITSLIAGASAGIISDGITHPISTAKSRLQVTKIVGAKPPSTSAVLLSIIRDEGWTKLYAGFGTVTVAAPARAMYFLGYELSRRQGDKIFGPNHALTSFLSGPIAQLSGSLLWVPMDVVKERLQIQRNVPLPTAPPATTAAAAVAADSASASAAAAAAAASSHGNTRFTGSWNAATTILQQEGIRGWYRGYVAHQCVWGPFNAVYFTGYEFLKHQWGKYLNPPPARAHSTHHVSSGETFTNEGVPVLDLHDKVEAVNLPGYAFPICGAVSGCLAAAASAPLDLIKTRLQTQGSSGQYTGAIDCARKIIRHEGAASMMRGLGARCLWLSPNIALGMTTYELIKQYFNV